MPFAEMVFSGKTLTGIQTSGLVFAHTHTHTHTHTHSPSPAYRPDAYRPDIDGLRAFAVLAVVAFHAFPATVKAGFIGVDVFFVISGYLISGIILNDLREGTFTLRRFYSRRIRRIFPALILVLAAALGFGWFVLFPDEYRALGKHVAGGASFIANFLLWQEAGYFDAAAKAKPLLHLWSLGIEEQFYIVFPLLLWLCAAKRLRILTVIIALGLASFLGNMRWMKDPTMDFYSPLVRMWELLAGAALCAAMRQESVQGLYLKLDAVIGKVIYDKDQEPDGRTLSLVCAVLGVILLIVALRLVREGVPYPGRQALWPVAGTVLLLAAGPLNPISRHLLGNRVSVFVGLVSYPFYLWHWTLISYAFIISGELDASTRWLRVMLVAASFVLAVLTYLLVEKPIRFGARARKKKVYALIAGMIVMGILGTLVYYEQGVSVRMASKKEVLSYTQWGDEDLQNPICMKRFTSPYKFCMIAEDAAPTVALLGDSFANAYFPGLAEEFRMRGENLVQLGGGGCPPLLDIAGGPEGRENWCDGSASRAIREIAALSDVHTVLLAADWHLYITGSRLNGDFNASWKIRQLSSENSEKSNAEIFNAQLRKTMDFLINSGKHVIIIKQTPAFDFNPITCLLQRPINFSKKTCTMSSIDEKRYLHEYEIVLENILIAYPNVNVLDPFAIFFPNDKCILSKDNIPLFRDGTPHLSHFGSRYVAGELMKNWRVSP